MAAALCVGEILTAWTPFRDPELSSSAVVVRTPCDFDTGKNGCLPPGAGGITTGKWSSRAS